MHFGGEPWWKNSLLRINDSPKHPQHLVALEFESILEEVGITLRQIWASFLEMEGK